MDLPLPITLYIGAVALFIGVVYNLLNWNTVRYYLQCTYPEQSGNVMTLMVFNKTIYFSAMCCFAVSPLLAGNVLEAFGATLLGIPMALMCWLFYKIFAHLHKTESKIQQEVK